MYAYTWMQIISFQIEWNFGEYDVRLNGSIQSIHLFLFLPHFLLSFARINKSAAAFHVIAPNTLIVSKKGSVKWRERKSKKNKRRKDGSRNFLWQQLCEIVCNSLRCRGIRSQLINFAMYAQQYNEWLQAKGHLCTKSAEIIYGNRFSLTIFQMIRASCSLTKVFWLGVFFCSVSCNLWY